MTLGIKTSALTAVSKAFWALSIYDTIHDITAIYAKCYYAEFHTLFIVMLNVITLSLVILNVLMLNDVVPF